MLATIRIAKKSLTGQAPSIRTYNCLYYWRVYVKPGLDELSIGCWPLGKIEIQHNDMKKMLDRNLANKVSGMSSEPSNYVIVNNFIALRCHSVPVIYHIWLTVILTGQCINLYIINSD